MAASESLSQRILLTEGRDTTKYEFIARRRTVGIEKEPPPDADDDPWASRVKCRVENAQAD
jgi:hypothetical protein